MIRDLGNVVVLSVEYDKCAQIFLYMLTVQVEISIAQSLTSFCNRMTVRICIICNPVVQFAHGAHGK